MTRIRVTVVGNVGTDVTHNITERGGPHAKFTLASTHRYFDRKREAWANGDTSWFTVHCWRDLADHVASSVAKGDPVIVTGVLQVRNWETDNGTGKTVLIDAETVGHDLTRGVSVFQRRARGTWSAPTRDGEPARPAVQSAPGAEPPAVEGAA